MSWKGGLTDRRTRTKRFRSATPQAIIERIEGLRRQRLTGQTSVAHLPSDGQPSPPTARSRQAHSFGTN